MELEDMKAMWEAQDRKLDAILRLNSKLLQKANLDKADTAMKRLFRGLLFEIVLNFGAVVLLGWFISDHLTQIRFLIPAVVLDVCVIALNTALIRQLVAIKYIDYDAPILVIQKKLELLNIQRIDALKWTLLSCPLLWVPLQIVAFQGLFGVDVYAYFGMDYLVANLLFGLAVIPLAVWISKSYASRTKRSGLVQRLMGALAGSDLNAAIGFLNALTRFEKKREPTDCLPRNRWRDSCAVVERGSFSHAVDGGARSVCAELARPSLQSNRRIVNGIRALSFYYWR